MRGYSSTSSLPSSPSPLPSRRAPIPPTTLTTTASSPHQHHQHSNLVCSTATQTRPTLQRSISLITLPWHRRAHPVTPATSPTNTIAPATDTFPPSNLSQKTRVFRPLWKCGRRGSSIRVGLEHGDTGSANVGKSEVTASPGPHFGQERDPTARRSKDLGLGLVESQDHVRHSNATSHFRSRSQSLPQPFASSQPSTTRNSVSSRSDAHSLSVVVVGEGSAVYVDFSSSTKSMSSSISKRASNVSHRDAGQTHTTAECQEREDERKCGGTERRKERRTYTGNGPFRPMHHTAMPVRSVLRVRQARPEAEEPIKAPCSLPHTNRAPSLSQEQVHPDTDTHSTISSDESSLDVPFYTEWGWSPFYELSICSLLGVIVSIALLLTRVGLSALALLLLYSVLAGKGGSTLPPTSDECAWLKLVNYLYLSIVFLRFPGALYGYIGSAKMPLDMRRVQIVDVELKQGENEKEAAGGPGTVLPGSLRPDCVVMTKRTFRNLCFLVTFQAFLQLLQIGLSVAVLWKLTFIQACSGFTYVYTVGWSIYELVIFVLTLVFMAVSSCVLLICRSSTVASLALMVQDFSGSIYCLSSLMWWHLLDEWMVMRSGE